MPFAEAALAESLCAWEGVAAHCGQAEEVCHS